ncbi:MAG: heme o synthase [Paracoccaceae bacterium]
MTDITQATPLTRDAGPFEPSFGDYVRLLKPRVMSLVVFTAVAGLVAAPAAVHPVIAIGAILCIAIGAGAAGALNMWWDADIDAEMSRTARRPVPAGAVEATAARDLGLGLSVLSVAMLAVVANPLAAFMLAFTIFFYAVIYTMWLKRSTAQNIVIGGAAGAFPPVVAWAAATGDMPLAAWMLFAVIFLWTPPHFWALALWKAREYRDVSVPMLPVVAGDRATRRQILIYTALLAPVSVLAAFTEAGDVVLLATAVAMSGRFLGLAWLIARRSEAEAVADRFAAEKRLFGFSIAYLFALFAAVILDAGLGAALGGRVLPPLF